MQLEDRKKNKGFEERKNSSQNIKFESCVDFDVQLTNLCVKAKS